GDVLRTGRLAHLARRRHGSGESRRPHGRGEAALLAETETEPGGGAATPPPHSGNRLGPCPHTHTRPEFGNHRITGWVIRGAVRRTHTTPSGVTHVHSSFRTRHRRRHRGPGRRHRPA